MGTATCAAARRPTPMERSVPNHVVTMANLHFQIFDKSGNSLFGPAANNTLWSGFGGDCQTDNAGDPVVLYDQLADRWILTQFTSSGPTFFECVAVSQTNDPTGSYFRYAISTGNNFPDYPKGGVWPDAYYFSTREFLNGSQFVGAWRVCAGSRPGFGRQSQPDGCRVPCTAKPVIRGRRRLVAERPRWTDNAACRKP